jgi:hypothetical protein
MTSWPMLCKNDPNKCSHILKGREIFSKQQFNQDSTIIRSLEHRMLEKVKHQSLFSDKQITYIAINY